MVLASSLLLSSAGSNSIFAESSAPKTTVYEHGGTQFVAMGIDPEISSDQSVVTETQKSVVPAEQENFDKIFEWLSQNNVV
jgi:hypothetical protein